MVLLPFLVQAQYAGLKDSASSIAVHKDSSLVLSWATNCAVERGFSDVNDPNLGAPTVGNEESAIGVVDGLDVLSLGDGGKATLTFDRLIKNGPGYDLAVFENSFSDNFLELAFVEVSSDGIHFVRFPSVSLTPADAQVGAFDSLTTSRIHNLAGKYPALYGTPFDLEQLVDSPGVDVNAITHVRVVDVVGSIDPLLCSKDSQGNMVNDPYPTPFSSGGFDLDGVAVLGEQANALASLETKRLRFYPNPTEGLVSFSEAYSSLELYSIQGQLIRRFNNVQGQFDLSFLKPGQYTVQLVANEKIFREILFVK